MTSSKMAPSWILPKIRNYKKGRKLKFFDAKYVEYDVMKHFAASCQDYLLFRLKKVKTRIFIQNGLTTCYLWLIHRNHSNRLSSNLVKMCLRDMRTATENRGCRR